VGTLPDRAPGSRLKQRRVTVGYGSGLQGS